MDRSFDNDELKKYRENQVYYHKEISNKIFDLLVKYKNTNNPLSKVLVLMKKNNSVFERRTLKGFMKDLTNDEIKELSLEFFIYHDSSGLIRSERYTDPEENHKRVYCRGGVPTFYIVQGNNGDPYNRHNITTWSYPNDIESTVNSEDHNAICLELFNHGFGNYNEYTSNNGEVKYYYDLYDNTDERHTQHDKVNFIEIFSNLKNNDELPELFVYYDNKKGTEVLSLMNWMSYATGPLGMERSSRDIDLEKVPNELKDKWLLNITKIPCIKWPNQEDIKKEGELWLFPDQEVHSSDYLQILGEHKEPELKKSTIDDMLCSLVNNIPLKDVNVDPEYQEFITDLMKQEKTKTRDDIERKAIRKLYHDFGPSTFPKLLLVEDLQDAKYTEMYKRAVSGDYDF